MSDLVFFNDFSVYGEYTENSQVMQEKALTYLRSITVKNSYARTHFVNEYYESEFL